MPDRLRTNAITSLIYLLAASRADDLGRVGGGNDPEDFITMARLFMRSDAAPRHALSGEKDSEPPIARWILNSGMP